MTRFFALFLAVLLFSAVLVSHAKAANDLSVNALRIGTHPDKTRLVVELSHKTDFRAFLLQNPSRLVIDLPAFDWRAGAPVSPPGSLVGTIRNGVLQPGISRIVIDLKTPSTLKSAFSLPSGPGISDRLVIDLVKVSGAYDASQERMFGTLNSGSPPQAAPMDNTDHVLRPPVTNTPYEAPSETVSTPAPQNNKGPKPMIVIDAGHGGDDPGAPGANGKREKDVTLAVAKELGRQLEASGRYRVHLTRSTDIFIKLQDRVAIGRKNGADLFISLHADSIDKPGVSGASLLGIAGTTQELKRQQSAWIESRLDPLQLKEAS